MQSPDCGAKSLIALQSAEERDAAALCFGSSGTPWFQTLAAERKMAREEAMDLTDIHRAFRRA
jgi:hypothetical protein